MLYIEIIYIKKKISIIYIYIKYSIYIIYSILNILCNFKYYMYI